MTRFFSGGKKHFVYELIEGLNEWAIKRNDGKYFWAYEGVWILPTDKE